MPYLGVPYRLVYISKAFSPGLTDVMAIVLRPDNSTFGPVSLSGVPAAGFSGSYYYDYPSTVNDPEGEYIVSTISATENVRDVTRFTLEQRPPLPNEIVIQPEPGPINVTISTEETVIEPNLSPADLNVTDEVTQIALTPSETNITIEPCQDP